MRTGFNLLLWTTHVTEDQFHLFETLKNVGYDGVEVPVFEGDVSHFRKVGEALRNQGLACSAVTIVPDEARNPISPDASSRQGAVDHLKWAVDCSAALGADVLCGPFHQPLAVFTGQGPTEEEKQRGVDVHRQAADHAEPAGITLAIEFLNRFECYILNTMDDAADYARRVGKANFGTMLDTFHTNIEEKDPVGCIAPNIDQIKHVHVSENDRGTPGRGHVDFLGTFQALRSAGYDGWITVEAFGRALPDLAAATKVWRDFFSSREEVYTEGLDLIHKLWEKAGGA